MRDCPDNDTASMSDKTKMTQLITLGCECFGKIELPFAFVFCFFADSVSLSNSEPRTSDLSILWSGSESGAIPDKGAGTKQC